MWKAVRTLSAPPLPCCSTPSPARTGNSPPPRRTPRECHPFCVANPDADGTGIDAYVVARAEGETVRVVRFDNGAVHEIASPLTAATTDMSGDADVTIGLTSATAS